MARSDRLRIDFWDVGQGDCSVLTLPDRSLFLIDVGPKGSPVIDWLNDRPGGCPVIHGVVLTHNDADHAGALPSLLHAHGPKVRNFWMLRDRHVSETSFRNVFRSAEEAERRGCFTIQNVETGKVVWEDGALGCRLHIAHPTFSENTNALVSGDANRSSSMLVLSGAGQDLVVWPGDLEIMTTARKIPHPGPRVLVGPHHGAPSDLSKKPEVAKAIQRISPGRAFISVGTTNRYSHPRPRYIQGLAGNGTKVVCSEVTGRCSLHHTNSRIPVFNGTGLLGLRPPRSGVSCRGAWRVEWDGSALHFDAHDAEHRRRIMNLRRPQCLFGAGWRKGDPEPV